MKQGRRSRSVVVHGCTNIRSTLHVMIITIYYELLLWIISTVQYVMSCLGNATVQIATAATVRSQKS